MKRSKTARLVLMATAPFVLSACGGKEPAVIYSSAEECARDSLLSEAACQENYRDARAQHENTAPRYGSRTDCEADFGASHCENTPSHNGSFMPMMMGFLAANAMQKSSSALRPTSMTARSREENCANPPCSNNAGGGYSGSSGVAGGSSGNGNWRAQPLYRSADDSSTWRTAGNTSLGSRSGPLTVDSAATRPVSMAKTLSRGGFGAQAAMRSASSSGG